MNARDAKARGRFNTEHGQHVDFAPGRAEKTGVRNARHLDRESCIFERLFSPALAAWRPTKSMCRRRGTDAVPEMSLCLCGSVSRHQGPIYDDSIWIRTRDCHRVRSRPLRNCSSSAASRARGCIRRGASPAAALKARSTRRSSRSTRATSPARAAVVSSRAWPHRPLRLQPACRRRRDVCGGQRQRGVCARRRDRQRDLDLRDRRHADQSRIQLLGEQGPLRSAHHLRVPQLSAAARCENGQADYQLRHKRPRQSARGSWAHADADRRRAVGLARTRVREPSCARIGAR